MEGHDARNTYDDTDEELFKIKKYLEMKKLLIMLESDKISTNNKLDIISNYDLLEYKLGENIYAGGLLDDWNF